MIEPPLGPLLMVMLVSCVPTHHTKRHLDRLSHFCMIHNRGQQTDRQTDRRADHPAKPATIGRLLSLYLTLRCALKITNNILVSLCYSATNALLETRTKIVGARCPRLNERPPVPRKWKCCNRSCVTHSTVHGRRGSCRERAGVMVDRNVPSLYGTHHAVPITDAIIIIIIMVITDRRVTVPSCPRLTAVLQQVG